MGRAKTEEVMRLTAIDISPTLCLKRPLLAQQVLQGANVLDESIRVGRRWNGRVVELARVNQVMCLHCVW